MANKIEQDAATAGKVVLSMIDGKYIVTGFEDVAKAAAVLTTVLSDHTELQKVLTTVVTDGAALALQIGKVIIERGDSWSDDAALITAMKEFFTTDMNLLLLPEFRKVYGEIKADVKTTPSSTTTVVTTTTTAAA